MKFWLVVFVLIFAVSPSIAVEEVVLKTDEQPVAKTTYLFEEALTKHFDNSIIESVHLFGYYRAGVDVDIFDDDTDTGYSFSSLNAGVNGKFKDGNTVYEARFRFNPQHDYSFFQYLPSNIYVANTAIPHHTVILGNARPPTGYEGGMSYTEMPFFSKAQISRNFGNVRKVGLRVKGNYDYIDYDLGGYSSDTYFRKIFPGAEFVGRVAVKPLGKNNKYGDLKLGGTFTSGHNDIDYLVTSAYAVYEYKKFFANFEYAKADGYNGAKRLTSDKAEGFYTTVGYKVHPKVQVLARYDQYTPKLSRSDDIRREYSAGVNYFIKGQALKLILNYVFCQNDLLKDSHRIILGTQVLL